MKNCFGKRVLVTALALCLCLLQWQAVLLPVSAASVDATTPSAAADAAAEEQNYREVKAEYVQQQYPTAVDTITVTPEMLMTEDKAVTTQSGIADREAPAFLWTKETKAISFTISVPTAALYQVEMDYYIPEGYAAEAQRRILVDGALPYTEFNEVAFTRWWKDASAPPLNNIGDEVRPAQEEIAVWHTMRVTDSIGLDAEPTLLYLTAGAHTVTMEYILQDMALGEIRFVPPLTYPTYAEYATANQQAGYTAGTDVIRFQTENTENIVMKSAASIAQVNSGDPCNEPFNMKNIVLNCMGGTSWATAGQTIVWTFDVKSAGLYKLAFWVQQNGNDGLPVYRQIAIDGQIPFREMLAYRFDYDKKWQTRTLEDAQGKPYLFYLDAGTHTLSMTVTMGELGDIAQDVFDTASACSEVLQKIVKITGSSPDTNFEYELPDKIPGLLYDMQQIVDTLHDCMDRVQALSTIKKPSMVSTLNMVSSTFEDMIERPDYIPRMLDDIRTAQEQLGTWYTTSQSLPLTVDYVWVAPEGEKTVGGRSSFWRKLLSTCYQFLVSFTRDYNSIGGVESETTEVLDVWIARGREWGQTLKELSDAQFTSEYKIAVNVRMLPASQLEAGAVNALMLAVNSGNVPDVALGLASTSPVEYAIRGALTDLRTFEDYEEVAQRFHPQSSVPYAYRNGMYALPETMDFRALYYRTDIFEEYGLKVPDTWDEIYTSLLPALYQNNLEFYIPADYTPFLLQHGGSYYTEDHKASALDTAIAYKAFKEYTEMFTSYGVPVSANFYMRMRTGEMPIGIGTYAEYVMLKTAAPELMGRWAMAPVPGQLKEDGTIDRTVGGIASTACVIMNGSDAQEAAWKFLKWYTSTDMQLEYGRNLESYIGVSARWNTANTEAFVNLPWTEDEIGVIRYMWNWVKETPVVLGSYMNGRNVYNAWNSVVIGGEDPRTALENAVETINREMQMKQLEYGE